MRSLRYRWGWLAVGVGLVMFVVHQSLTTHPIESADVGGLSFGHFLAYFTLTLWFAQLYEGRASRLLIATLFILMGVGLEYAQGLTTYRTFDLADMRDNAIGVAVGFASAWSPLGGALAWLERRMGVSSEHN